MNSSVTSPAAKSAAAVAAEIASSGRPIAAMMSVRTLRMGLPIEVASGTAQPITSPTRHEGRHGTGAHADHEGQGDDETKFPEAPLHTAAERAIHGLRVRRELSVSIADRRQ